jgi:predicted house-cleaning noncanonical NTP pyrophosphatase (MazG superfamily)
MIQQQRSGKLVRDRIPDIIRANGGDSHTTVLDDREYTLALQAKVHEEIEELLASPADKRTEELADIVEVLYALAEHYGLDWDAVEIVRLRKKHERGGFEGRVWLEP